ncbi:MAG: hypothetical protein KDA84_25255 [Planctomycetaceae bacterium]|nr:hypothetical protein [Planctomycetaceae bacterium]
MKILFWREWRWNRLILVAGLVFFLIPYFTSTVAALWPRNQPLRSFEIAALYILAAMISLCSSQLTLVCLAGNAFAGERLDRSSEFLALLPVSKWNRMLAKLILSALTAGLTFALNWLVVWRLLGFLPVSIREETDFVFVFKLILSAGFVMFGVAWCFSSVESNPTIAVDLGILAPIVVLMSLVMVDSMLVIGMVKRNQLLEIGFPFACVLWGALGIWVGSWCFLDRVEP